MAASTDLTPASVSLLALPETTQANLYGVFEVLSSAGVTWSELTGEAIEARRMATSIVARGREAFDSMIGTPIGPHAALGDITNTDIVIVTDLSLPMDSDPRGRWQEEARWVRDQFDRGAIVCSVCTGSIFLAEAGLLDGREATTHWAAADIFRKHYPDVRLYPERILCAGDSEHRVITGGGASSWEDLALYLIARFCDDTEAMRIAKIFLLGDRSEGQLPFSGIGCLRKHQDAAIGGCQVWIADHYAGPNPVARMVEQSGLPERTFKRRFRAATGYTPLEYVQTLRIEEAKQILETTNEPTDSVAHAIGYEDPAFFRRLFKRRAGVTPARYRQRFQTIIRLRPPT
jgi:transcriptional regulator GlxA family with amidase domain